MNLRNQFYARLVWPLFDRGYAGLGTRLAAWKRLERASEAEARAAQWGALRRLLVHAQDTCPFYRERFAAAGLDPRRMRAAEELERIPPLTRAELREQGEAMRSSAYDPGRLAAAASGGTTDVPVRFWRDAESVRAKRAVQEAFNGWAGRRPGDKIFQLWGAQSDLPANPNWRWRTRERYVHRALTAPASHLSGAVLEQYRAALNRFRPRTMQAYPSPLAVFAEHLLAHPGPLHRLKGVVCTAEALLPQQRETIERAFGCPVFEQYGSREFGMIAAQCEMRQGMHLNPHAAFVEFRPVAGAGELRELLVTDLLNYGMPLIRYQINDCVSGPAAACGCGRGYPLLPPVSGRTADLLRLPDGSLVPGVALTGRILTVCPRIVKMQVVQESLREFRFRYVPGKDFAKGGAEEIQSALRRFFPQELHWQLEAVEEIPREASGKTRFCISHVPPQEVADAGIPV